MAEGFSNYSPDPYALAVYENGSLTFVNALSANDLTSCLHIYEAWRTEGERLVILINNREDRPARALEMLRLCALLKPASVWLMGDQKTALRRYLKKDCPDSEIRLFRKAEEVPLSSETKTLLLAVGNIKNEGITLSDRVEKQLRRKGESGNVQ